MWILQSCPAIRVFSGENLERGLDAAAKNFCSQEVRVDNNMVKNIIFLPFFLPEISNTHPKGWALEIQRGGDMLESQKLCQIASL